MYDDTHPYVKSSDSRLFYDLGEQHSTLRKVYCIDYWADECCSSHSDSWIWELEDSWQGKQVDSFTTWDIMQNSY